MHEDEELSMDVIASKEDKNNKKKVEGKEDSMKAVDLGQIKEDGANFKKKATTGGGDVIGVKELNKGKKKEDPKPNKSIVPSVIKDTIKP
jgi:hypothetical protein